MLCVIIIVVVIVCSCCLFYVSRHPSEIGCIPQTQLALDCLWSRFPDWLTYWIERESLRETTATANQSRNCLWKLVLRSCCAKPHLTCRQFWRFQCPRVSITKARALSDYYARFSVLLMYHAALFATTTIWYMYSIHIHARWGNMTQSHKHGNLAY